MNEMKKVYLVVREWHSNDGCPDNWYNNDEESVEGVFSTAEKAVDFIVDRLAEQRKEAILYEQCCSLISKMPTKEELLIDLSVEVKCDWGETVVWRVQEEVLDEPARRSEEE